MDDSTYQLVSTALLGVIALLLIFVIARLARVERTLRGSREERSSAGAPAVDGAVAAALAEPSETTAQPPATDGADAPFERDGRWWYRQGDEELVYDEQTEAWVSPDAPAPAMEPEPVIEPHPLDEARGWDAEPQTTTTPEEATAAPIAEPVSAPEPITTGIHTGVVEEPAEQPAERPAAGGAHWKCPACGVINGSTATSCRMCFAARP